MMRVEDVLTLTPSAQGYLGRCVAGRETRVFGGHTLAHSVLAASESIGDSRRVSSIHAHFLSPGDANELVEYRPTTLKRGRAFDNIRVSGFQGERRIIEATTSFHSGEPAVEHQIAKPNVPHPQELTEDTPKQGTELAVRAPFDIRTVAGGVNVPESDTWMRTHAQLEWATATQHAALLAYAIDFLITQTAHKPLDESSKPYFGASLDHAMWFHRPVRIDEWLLIHTEATAYIGSRSLSHASIFNESEDLVASAVQEAIIRRN